MWIQIRNIRCRSLNTRFSGREKQDTPHLLRNICSRGGNDVKEFITEISVQYEYEKGRGDAGCAEDSLGKMQQVRRSWFTGMMCVPIIIFAQNVAGYFRLNIKRRLKMTVDSGSFEEWDTDLETGNPLQFEGYEEKIKAAQEKTSLAEGVVTGKAAIEGLTCAIGVIDARFLMGSMGYVVGEKNHAHG